MIETFLSPLVDSNARIDLTSWKNFIELKHSGVYCLPREYAVCLSV